MGSIQSFTPAGIDSLSEGKRSDPLIPGLFIEIAGQGRKVWRYRRRVTKSRTIVTVQLGYFPAFTIPAAREWASALNEAVERGEDPRVALRAEASRTAMTVQKAHSLYMDAMRRGDRKRLKRRTLKDKEVMFTRDIEPRLDSVLLDELTEDACWDAVYDKAEASKVRANKMAGELSCFLRWCAGREGQMAGTKLAAHPAPTLNSNWLDTGPKANQRFHSRGILSFSFELCGETTQCQAISTMIPGAVSNAKGLATNLVVSKMRRALFARSNPTVNISVWENFSKPGSMSIIA